MPTGVYLRTKPIKPISEETRVRLRLSHLGHKHPEDVKEKIGLASSKRIRKPESYKKMWETRRKNGTDKGFHWKLSQETRQKMSLAQKGKKLSEEHKRKIRLGSKGRPAWNKGLKGWTIGTNAGYQKGHPCYLTQESLEKIRQKMLGYKNHQWRGGKSFEPYSPTFNNQLKLEVKKRDNFHCQECFRHENELYTKTGRKYKLHIHHIDYNKKNNLLNNLISLCRSCHLQTNFKREDWQRYFNHKLSL